MRFKKGGAAREPRAGSKVRASIALKTCYLGTSLNFFVIKTGGKALYNLIFEFTYIFVIVC